EALAGDVGFAVAEKDRAGGAVFPEILGALCEDFGIALLEYEALRGELDRRTHQFSSGPSAMTRAGELEASDGAGNAGRQISPRRQQRYRLPARIQKHGARRCGR